MDKKLTDLLPHFNCNNPMDLIYRHRILERLIGTKMWIGSRPFNIKYYEHEFYYTHVLDNGIVVERLITRDVLSKVRISLYTYQEIIGEPMTVDYSNVHTDAPKFEKRSRGPNDGLEQVLALGLTAVFVIGVGSQIWTRAKQEYKKYSK